MFSVSVDGSQTIQSLSRYITLVYDAEDALKLQSRLEDLKVQVAKHQAQIDTWSEEQTWADELEEDPASATPEQRGLREEHTASRQSLDQIATLLLLLASCETYNWRSSLQSYVRGCNVLRKA